jgi:hypothetical protein
MKEYKLYLKSTSPYSPSRLHETPKLQRELADAYEERTWREKAHFKNGHMIIPANQFKSALSEAAKSLAMQIPGKGKRTFTQSIKSGTYFPEDLVLKVKKEEMESVSVWCNAQGKPGVGARVKRIFPNIPAWEGSIPVVILDEIVTQEVLVDHLVQAGSFIGIGRWRPSVGGYNGRFEVVECKFVK